MKFATALVAALLGCVPFAEAAPDIAAPTVLQSPDCISVHADGEPSDMCGFQVASASPDLERIFTVSVTGTVRVWGGDGRVINEVKWADDPATGFSGHPSASAGIGPNAALAIIHYNQAIVLELATGRERLRRTLPFMSVTVQRMVGSDKALVETFGREPREERFSYLDLRTGELSAPFAFAPSTVDWALGVRDPDGRPNLILADVAMTEIPLDKGCAPVAGARACVAFRHDGRSTVDIFDVDLRRWGNMELGTPLGEHTQVRFSGVSGDVWAAVCRSEDPSNPFQLRNCFIRNLSEERTIADFRAPYPLIGVGLSVASNPELRALAFESYRVAAPQDFAVLRVASDGAVMRSELRGVHSYRLSLTAPDGGYIVPADHEGWSFAPPIWVAPDGTTRAQLYSAYGAIAAGCGWAMPGYDTPCSVGKRAWLQLAAVASGEDGIVGEGLVLYRLQ